MRLTALARPLDWRHDRRDGLARTARPCCLPALTGSARLDACKPTVSAAADRTATKLDLAAMWPTMQQPNVGLVKNAVNLRGRGNSVADMPATAAIRISRNLYGLLLRSVQTACNAVRTRHV